MSDLKAIEYKRFEDIKHVNENGSEYWSARELAIALDYVQWRNFEKVIKRAMIACENSGHDVLDDFAEVSKIVEAGATHKSTKDYELSRYACYLIVQNGDPRKEVIALGQTYFAIQTYRQEVADHFNELDEDNRRLVVRGDIKQWNQMLAELQMKSLLFFKMRVIWDFMVGLMWMIFIQESNWKWGRKFLIIWEVQS